MAYQHKRIHKFSIDGSIYDDSALIRLKEQFYCLLVSNMREKGYVPRVDIDPDFSLHYTGEHYTFVMSVYGIYIGKGKSRWIEGIDKNRPIASFQKSKSENASQESA